MPAWQLTCALIAAQLSEQAADPQQRALADDPEAAADLGGVGIDDGTLPRNGDEEA